MIQILSRLLVMFDHRCAKWHIFNVPTALCFLNKNYVECNGSFFNSVSPCAEHANELNFFETGIILRAVVSSVAECTDRHFVETNRSKQTFHNVSTDSAEGNCAGRKNTY